MTKFEEIGTERIALARTQEHTERVFAKSCDLCCSRGIRLECGRCAIETAFNAKMGNYKRVGAMIRSRAHA